VREYYGQFVSKQAQSVIDDILAKRSMAGGMPGIAGMPGIYIYIYIYILYIHIYIRIHNIYVYVYIYIHIYGSEVIDDRTTTGKCASSEWP